MEKKLLEKISKIQQEIGVLSKDIKGYNYKYTDINQILGKLQPLLVKYDLILNQPIKAGYQQTVITDLKTGEEVMSELELPKDVEPQKMGSACTYYRRYTLVSLLALQAEDDDAASLKKAPSKTPPGDIQNLDVPF